MTQQRWIDACKRTEEKRQQVAALQNAPEMIDFCELALEPRAQGIIKF